MDLVIKFSPDSDKTSGAAPGPSRQVHGPSETPTLVDLKNGKVIFKQKPVSLEKQSETLQEIVRFRVMLEERIDRQEPPLDAFPDDHKPVIAKLAHESDKTLPTLAKHIRHELLPVQDEDNDRTTLAQAALPLSIVENAVTEIMNRSNYGLESTGSAKTPASLCVWRWEVKAEHWDWLPKNVREKAGARLSERVQARQDLRTIFESLPLEERIVILNPKGNKSNSKDLDTATQTELVKSAQDNDQSTVTTSTKQRMKNTENEDIESDSHEKGLARGARMKKAVDPEKAVREKERQEKKAAKAEKDRREKSAQDKSRSLMANFFSKTKAGMTTKGSSSDTATSAPALSEFERSFKAFTLKRDTELAPINWFLESRKKRNRTKTISNNVIILLDDEVEDACQTSEPSALQSMAIDIDSLSPREHLQTILRSIPNFEGASPYTQGKRVPGMKTNYHDTVRNLISKLSEAELAGDIPLVRSLLNKLSDRTLFPAKVFIFAEDARPGYYGTWTRNSRLIGSRTPLARDVLAHDYNYDSGEEWEGEDAGDGEDVIDDGEEEDDGEEADSDLDSWLVDDDEEPGVSIHVIDPSQIPDILLQPLKRKADDPESKKGKKRKVVVPLVPFAKGPCWESSIGQRDNDLFGPYQIQLFNDTPFPIDPFTYISCVEDKQEKIGTAQIAGGFAVPNVPDRIIAVKPAMSSMKRPLIAPKTTFPDVHLPFLLNKITKMQAPNITLLVETLYQDLREHNVKKNAIEVKVREVGEKCRKKKVWIVKPDYQDRYNTFLC